MINSLRRLVFIWMIGVVWLGLAQAAFAQLNSDMPVSKVAWLELALSAKSIDSPLRRNKLGRVEDALGRGFSLKAANRDFVSKGTEVIVCAHGDDNTNL